MSDTPKTTIIEDGTLFEGAVQSLGPITVSGDMQGRLEAPEVEVTETGSVRGEIKVGRFCSCGQIGGRLDVEDLELSGTVHDGTLIQAGTIHVAPGAGDTMQVTFGDDCELRVGTPSSPGGTSGSRETVGVDAPVESRDAAPELEEEPAL